jgi:ABC-type multidrug transport system ATPase subunit
LADRVAILAEGRILACGPPADLGSGVTEIRFRLPSALAPSDLPADIRPAARVEDAFVVVDTNTPTATAAQLAAWATANDVGELAGFAIHPPTLEDTYLRLVHGPVDG